VQNIRSEWTAIVLARILKILGERKSRELRLVSKQTRDTIDSVYSMAFPSADPRIFVRCPGFTGSRATRVRSILTGPNGPNGTDGTKKAPIVLACDAAGPGADETNAIREFLEVHTSYKVELVVSGDFLIMRGTCALRALRALRAWVTKARFNYCTLEKRRIHMLVRILPPSLSALEFYGCTFFSPLDPLLDELPCLVHLGLGCCESRRDSFPPLASLAKLGDTLEILDMSGVKSRGAHQGLRGLADLCTAAKNVHTMYIGASLPFVPPDLARALLANSCLRELYADRCAFTFDILCDACDAISAAGRRPAPALEILDIGFNKNIGPVPSAVAFLRAVPSLKEIFLQETGLSASILAAAPNKAVVFHLSFAPVDASSDWIERAPVHWHRYPRPR
jgi:hypothetical protein